MVWLAESRDADDADSSATGTDPVAVASASVSTAEPDVAPGRSCRLVPDVVASAPGSCCSDVPSKTPLLPLPLSAPDPDSPVEPAAEDVAVAKVVGSPTSEPVVAAEPGRGCSSALVSDATAAAPSLVALASRPAGSAAAAAVLVLMLANPMDDSARGGASDSSADEVAVAAASAPAPDATPMVWIEAVVVASRAADAMDVSREASSEVSAPAPTLAPMVWKPAMDVVVAAAMLVSTAVATAVAVLSPGRGTKAAAEVDSAMVFKPGRGTSSATEVDSALAEEELSSCWRLVLEASTAEACCVLCISESP